MSVKLKRILSISLLAIFSSLVGYSWAYPVKWQEIHYYATAEKKEVVGEKSITCQSVYVSGQVTAYSSVIASGYCGLEPFN